jgi:hypothetical protein
MHGTNHKAPYAQIWNIHELTARYLRGGLSCRAMFPALKFHGLALASKIARPKSVIFRVEQAANMPHVRLDEVSIID